MSKFFLIILLLTLFNFSLSSLLFKLKDSNYHCLGGEFLGNSILVVKYRLYTPSRKDLSKVIPTLTINLKNVKQNRMLYSQHVFTVKDKLTYDIAEAGLYEVCIKTSQYSKVRDLREDLFVNIKMNPDYNEEDPMMSNAINSEDVNSIAIKAKQIVTISKPIIEGQENQLEKENEHSIKTLENAKLYKYLAFAQIAVTVFIGLIQVYNFRRFLKSQHVI
jgi:hypothetical protein